MTGKGGREKNGFPGDLEPKLATERGDMGTIVFRVNPCVICYVPWVLGTLGSPLGRLRAFPLKIDPQTRSGGHSPGGARYLGGVAAP